MEGLMSVALSLLNDPQNGFLTWNPDLKKVLTKNPDGPACQGAA
jgi:hypothetical protein